MQTFIKVVNYQHLMPTRYTLEVDLKNLVTSEALENATKRKETRKVCFPTDWHVCQIQNQMISWLTSRG